jgi:hypothetical protein
MGAYGNGMSPAMRVVNRTLNFIVLYGTRPAAVEDRLVANGTESWVTCRRDKA